MTIAAPQHELLRAVLREAALPGGSSPVRMPDLAFLRAAPEALLLADELADPAAMDDLPVRVVSERELAETARARGDTPYLRFRPAEPREGGVRLTLELGLAPAGPDRRPAGLSGVRAEFAEHGGRWTATGEPVYFAA